MNKKVTPEILAKAKAIGQKAYQNKTRMVPAQNSELMELMRSLNLKVGEGALEIMTAFVNEITKLSDQDFYKNWKW